MRTSEALSMLTQGDAARFWGKVHKSEGCWLWMGAKQTHGYGDFAMTRKGHVLAHRLSFAMANGAIDDSLCVMHRCDTPACVNPTHLLLGTLRDNWDDMRAKRRNRWGTLSGESSPLAKLRAYDIVRIVQKYREGGVTQLGLAREFGVAKSTIGRVLRGTAWKGVPRVTA